MLFKNFAYILWLALFFICACVPPTNSVITAVDSDFKQPIIQKIYNYQDSRSIDSLMYYLNDKNPAIRKLVVEAFGSIKDTTIIDSLVKKLDDPIIEVRSAAAYSLGQIGNAKALVPLIKAFKAKDTINVSNIMNANILEAVGKVGDLTALKNIATVEKYRNTDTLLLLGQIRSIYRFGLRGLISQEGTRTAVKYAIDNEFPSEVRLVAAHYLSRIKNIDINTDALPLMAVAELEKDIQIKQNILTAVGKTKNPEVGMRLVAELNKAEDYRIKCNILKILGPFSLDTIRPTIISYIKSNNIHVAKNAIEALTQNSDPKELYIYRGLLNDSMHWSVRSDLYAALLKICPLYFTKVKTDLSNEILFKIKNSTNEYEKSALTLALSNDPYQYLNIANLFASAKTPVEKTAIAESLSNIMTGPSFFKAYGEKYIVPKRYITDFLVYQCKTNADPGVVYTAATLFQNPAAYAKGFVRDSVWVEETLSKLKSPRDHEAISALKSCNAYLKGEKYVEEKPTKNHPINWSLLNDYDPKTSIVILKTTKGNIKIKMLPELAPGSVVNFIDLCGKGFYKDKYFHRVVSNFVIQAGCPRGDGFGALDYSIRSELDQAYYSSEGFVGMASAGNDTEGTQFFITHSSTPHLDGRYTIFGKVIDGMEIVHEIAIGDKIIDALYAPKGI